MSILDKQVTSIKFMHKFSFYFHYFHSVHVIILSIMETLVMEFS